MIWSSDSCSVKLAAGTKSLQKSGAMIASTRAYATAACAKGERHGERYFVQWGQRVAWEEMASRQHRHVPLSVSVIGVFWPPNGSALSYRPLTALRRLPTHAARRLPRFERRGPGSSILLASA